MSPERDGLELHFANDLPKVLPGHINRAIAGLLRRFAAAQTTEQGKDDSSDATRNRSPRPSRSPAI
jgi:hypothetical protein